MKISEQRIRCLVLGVLAFLAGYALSGCDGSSESGDLLDGASVAGLPRTEAGVALCSIPSPSGNVAMVDSKGAPTSTTMRSYYEHAASTGGAGSWGVVTNPSETTGKCQVSGKSAADCADSVKTCMYAACTWSTDGTNTQLCHLDGYGTWKDSREVAAALCTPGGQFAGWLCTTCRTNSAGVQVCVQG